VQFDTLLFADCNSALSSQFSLPPATSPSVDTSMTSLKTTDDVRLDDAMPNGISAYSTSVQQQLAVHTNNKHRKKPSAHATQSSNNIAAVRPSSDDFRTELVRISLFPVSLWSIDGASLCSRSHTVVLIRVMSVVL